MKRATLRFETAETRGYSEPSTPDPYENGQRTIYANLFLDLEEGENVAEIQGHLADLLRGFLADYTFASPPATPTKADAQGGDGVITLN